MSEKKVQKPEEPSESNKGVKHKRRRLYESAVEEPASRPKYEQKSRTSAPKSKNDAKRNDNKVTVSQAIEQIGPHDTRDRIAQAETEVKKWSLVSAGIGVIPAPVVDILAVTAIQLMLIRRIADIYEVPFIEKKGRLIIASLASEMGAFTMVGMFPIGIAKLVPGLGSVAGALAFPATAAATTYAVGKVMIKHLDSGGTFLDFNGAAMRDYYQSQYQIGKKEILSKPKT